ncbi:heavy-metal-associated domain-containing protein [Marinilongibacter aquaticus]|uniref:heavy-metal-associated domain-containing protein n=1 Tax=Marinilongibacter aquaticus TaxID=2975157 RepID=UPI0021BD59A7|nr:heavy metal-associated domain-containing protein [Marinilongibacter aquaticus]UBM59932.1 heavy-metal-associated domain-containing protein [Marinilongibacter aquaticus]
MKKISVLVFLFGLITTFGVKGQDFAKYDHVVQVKTSAICKMCKKRIERDLSLTKGVEKAELNLDNKVVTVAYNAKKTDADEIREAITKIGYDADDMPANEKSHDRLPECCQKDKKPH